MFALILSADVTLAEIISAHGDNAHNFVTGVMQRTKASNIGELYNKKDNCLHFSKVNRIFIDTDKFTTCMLGSSKRTTPRTPKRSNNTEEALPRNKAPEKKVNVDPDPDWARATRERILKGKQGDVVAVNQGPNRTAPYGSADCIEIKAAPNRGAVDWDYVILRNKCSYPIKVLTCYYDQGRGSDCVTKKGAKGWGQSDLLSPGETQTSVATSKKLPWFARSIVCDMREKSNLLCVLPD